MQRRDRLRGNESAHIADDGWEARPFRGGQDCTLKPVTTHQELRSQANLNPESVKSWISQASPVALLLSANEADSSHDPGDVQPF